MSVASLGWVFLRAKTRFPLEQESKEGENAQGLTLKPPLSVNENSCLGHMLASDRSQRERERSAGAITRNSTECVPLAKINQYACFLRGQNDRVTGNWA